MYAVVIVLIQVQLLCCLGRQKKNTVFSDLISLVTALYSLIIPIVFID